MKKMILKMVVLSVFLIFVLGCASQTSEKTTYTTSDGSVPASGAAISSAEEQDVSASADDLGDLESLSSDVDQDVNFDDLEELTN
jgi:hypothetical protein